MRLINPTTGVTISFADDNEKAAELLLAEGYEPADDEQSEATPKRRGRPRKEPAADE